MKDEEIAKALRVCAAAGSCADCPCYQAGERCARKDTEAANLIEKQAVEIRALRGAAGSLKAALEDAQKSIEVFGQANAALREKVPEWIPVKEQLPEPGKMVLLIVNGKVKNITLIGAYELGEFDTDEGWILEMWPEWKDPKVTHWMPLPEPPEEEKDEK